MTATKLQQPPNLRTPPGEKEIVDLENEIVASLKRLKSRTTESIRTVRREFSRRLAKEPPEFIVALALKLTRGQSVPRFFAYELVQHHAAAFRSLDPRSLEELSRGNDSWETVDSFACYLAGPAWREGQVSEALIRRWARSSDRWWRRTALASTVPLNNKARGGRGDTHRTLSICKLLLTDRDDMVVKALSWSLRELSKRDPESVRKFLKQNKNALAPRVIREVSNKLQTGLKNPRK
jgi:3-methyladenine DNA glycosylase AlkD